MRVLLDLAIRNPAENLALDEAILRAFAEGAVPPTLRVWRNPRSVIIGRGQRAEDEADLPNCRRLGIPVLRRPSGGGAVYHHPGNLNFSIFLPLTGPWAEVRRSQQILAELMAEAIRARLGLPAVADTGAVFVDGEKVSGSAQLRRRALLHHGTILLWPDRLPMEAMLLALRPHYQPRGVPSSPVQTGDLSSLRGEKMTVEEGVRTILRAFRPLGIPAAEEISLREWALAAALTPGYQVPLWTAPQPSATSE